MKSDMREAQRLTGGRPVAVLGCGLVGSGWAVVFARAGLAVRMFDRNPGAVRSALATVEQQLRGLERHGLMQEPAADVMDRVSVAPTLANAVRGAAYVQESVPERHDVKRELIELLDTVAGEDFVVGSSTSGIPASAFALELPIAPRVLIAHPVNPPSLVPLVELVPSSATSEQSLAFADALMRAVGQSVVHVRKEIQGFVLNRLQAVLLREAWALVEGGVATCEDVDKAVRDGLGWRWSFMGPFEAIDLNAPGGVADYARKLGPLYRDIAGSRTHDRGWDDALIAEVERQRRMFLGENALASRREWRDEQLMRFAAIRATGAVSINISAKGKA